MEMLKKKELKKKKQKKKRERKFKTFVFLAVQMN